MLGSFQKSLLRLEIEATQQSIAESLLMPKNLSQWLFPTVLSPGLPEKLRAGLNFTTSLGFVSVNHQVEIANDQCLCLLLSGAIDGYHQWYWGEGWLQSKLEGISILPLNLGQSLTWMRLRQYLSTAAATPNSSK